MIADLEAIRSESFEEVGRLIERGAERIIDRWQACAETEQPTAKRCHAAALRDHLPQLLAAIGANLAADADGRSGVHSQVAAKHGRERWEDGWSLDEVVRDYQILRRVLLEHLDAQLGRPLSLRENLAVGVVLDDAIGDSVNRFVSHREAAVRRQEQVEADRLREHADHLAAAERHKDEFLAILGHELRNPLGPLRNAVHLLNRRPDAETVAWAGELMDRQLRHLTRLVDDLLDSSRLARGKLDLRLDTVDLAALVRTAVEDRRRVIEEAGRTLEVEVAVEPIRVVGDADRLAQVLDNLLTNAQKFTDRGGKVLVGLSIEPDARCARITVADTGIGISAELVPHVFQRYRQAESDPVRPNGGLGLGLALVKGIIDLHGGTVAAFSDGPGAGASFVVQLPLYVETATAATIVPAKAKVLVIEDNQDGADSLAVLLRLFGFDVQVTYSGADGVAAAKAAPPDVALCDLGLPEMDGFRVAKILMSNPVTANVKMVAISGYGSAEERRRSAEVGFVRHVLKPVDPEELRELLDELTCDA